MMPLVTLRHLYFAELSDLYDAEQQVIRELPLMSAAATSAELRDAFDTHYRRTQRHVDRIEGLFNRMDERARVTPSRALRGIIEHARARNSGVERGDVLDAALIGTAQRIGHYKIAAYGSARTFALRLADLEAAEMLQQTHDEESSMDQELAGMAERHVEHEGQVPPPALHSPRASTSAWTGDHRGFTAAASAPRDRSGSADLVGDRSWLLGQSDPDE